MKLVTTLFLLLALMGTKISFAQDTLEVSTDEKVSELKGQVEGINETLLEMKSTLDAIKKIKVSGYIQAQFQSAQNDNVKSFAGGNFATFTHNRMIIRRGRIKFNYDNDLTNYVVQFDINEGGLSTKDAYITVKEPWMRTAELWAGLFNRPFGFEIEYSSSSRETPERTRMFQTLFPGERDLGAKLEIRPQDGFLNIFNLKLGLFNGNGIGAESDNYKDFIGRLGFSLPFTETNLALDGGVSLYSGKVKLDAAKKIYTLDNPSTVPTAQDASVQSAKRNYLGGDFQLYYDLPALGGFSLRGEYISGKQPGSAGDNKVYSRSQGDMYLRNFTGYYLWLVQNIGNDNQLIVKYDVFDPNKDVTGDAIGKVGGNSKLGFGDIKFTTIGLGWVYHWDANVKFVFYYDKVSNEKINAAATSATLLNGAGELIYKDDVRDNVFTVRVQYKF